MIAGIYSWLKGASRKEIGWTAIAGILLVYLIAYIIWRVRSQRKKHEAKEQVSVAAIQITAERCETTPGIGKEYFCEIRVANLPKETSQIAAFLTSWTPLPSEQIHHKMPHTKRIPTSADFPILLPELEKDMNCPGVRRFKCFHMPREGSEPTIEIVSQKTKFLSFQTSRPDFKITIEIKGDGVLLCSQTFQLEFVRGSGPLISYFKIEKL
jgi:hypothetical protein